MSAPSPEDFITYAEWGEHFFRVAVTEDRILGAVSSIAGRPIEFGPSKVDPLGLVKVTANGEVGEPVVSPRDESLVAFDMMIPVQLAIGLDVGPDKHRFQADVHVPLVLTARAAKPLTIVIDIEPPHKRDVVVDMRAEALRSSVLQTFTGIEGELRRYVAKFVKHEIEKPELQKARTIDVVAALSKLSANASASSATA